MSYLRGTQSRLHGAVHLANCHFLLVGGVLLASQLIPGGGKSFAQIAAIQFAEGAPFAKYFYKCKYVLSRL